MIWCDGRLVPDAALRVSVLDRTFEHGLGLFETLRTRRGRVAPLPRHLDRLQRSARELGLPLAGVRLPTPEDVAALLQAEKADGDRLVRITLSGGLDEASGARLWMQSKPLPLARAGASVVVGPWRVEPHDMLARHKTLNYWSRRRAHEAARAVGCDEALSVSEGSDGERIWEGSRTNLFVIRGERLATPGLDGPLVPGILRGLVVERAGQLGLDVTTGSGLLFSELAAADEVFLTNSVRGIIRVERVVHTGRGDTVAWPAPGAWTRRLAARLDDWLDSDEVHR